MDRGQHEKCIEISTHDVGDAGTKRMELLRYRIMRLSSIRMY